MSERIEGSIVKIHYYNQDNGYTVALFELDYKNQKNKKVKNILFGNTVTIVGFFDHQVYPDEEVILEGDFVNDSKYGLQFKFTSFERILLDNESGIIAYLSSDIFKGVGQKNAKKIVQALGKDTISLIKQDKTILDEIGLSENIKNTVYNGLINDEKTTNATIFLLNNGLSIEVSTKIINKFGPNIIEELKENPYILMYTIDHFGFKKNDQFALKLGIKNDATVRLKALLTYKLKELIYNSGNSYIERTKLYEEASKYIAEEIETSRFNEILTSLVNDKKIIIKENERIFDYALYQNEVELALEIVKLLKGIRNPSKEMVTYDKEQINNIYEELETTSEINFNAEQKKAITSAFTEPMVIITGGPGTGKTTIIKAIIKLYLKLNNDSSALQDKIALLAPTGRAAKRLKETTNMQAQTIHKFLGFTGGDKFEYNKFNKTSSRLIIVDEASMMDLPLAYNLVTSMNENARLIIVGDVDQLPSVGPGNILKDLIDTHEIKTIKLNKIHRQAENSSIISLAHSINEGIIPENMLEKFPDRTFIPTDNEHLPILLIDVYKKAIEKGKDIYKDVQVLIPMYKGDVGINEINTKIQEIVNPKKDEEVKVFGTSFREGDKVIQLVNHADKGIMNGDIGIIKSFKHKELKISGLTVLFDSNLVEYTLEELEELSLAYATSVHKAQGSEFELVIMPITKKHFIMLKRKLIYTAVTRAKSSLVLLGDIEALQMGVRYVENNRKTILKDLIINMLKESQNDLLKQIDDEESAFNMLGEEFTTLDISDFEN